jgi:hypothetical protein
MTLANRSVTKKILVGKELGANFAHCSALATIYDRKKFTTTFANSSVGN